MISEHDPAAAGRFVSYVRVSTDKQHRSGLGLEAQEEAVREFLLRRSANLVAEFVEIESGAKNDRPQLAMALQSCERMNATLLIAKLDRLGRNVAFISALMESKINFVAADNPHASRLMLHLLAAFAEHERDMIRERTRAALAAAKARGVKLGTNGAILAEKSKAEAVVHALSVAHHIQAAQASGAITLTAIATWLNQHQVPSRESARWHPNSVARVIKRLSSKLEKEPDGLPINRWQQVKRPNY